MIIDGAQATQNLKESYDVVIVGSGAGGAVLAKELAEGGMRVAILEEGAYHKTSSHNDLPYEAISRLYRDRGFTTTVGRPAIPVPLGKALGGTTVINSGTCFRTPSKIFHHWNQDLGLTDLDEKHFTPIFERIENELNVTEAKFEDMSRANLIFHELLAKKGIRGHALKRNVKGCEGCGFCCYGCPSGAKQSMDVSYLPKAFQRGAVAYTNCTFTELITSGRRVTGVRAQFHTREGASTGYSLKISAPVVVLAAGSILTPQLLRDNRVATENPNLGRNLTLHPATKVFARFDEEVRGWEGTPQAYYLDIFKDEGITFEGIFVPPDVAAMTVPFVGRRLNEFMRDYVHMASFGFLITDSGTGRVMKLPFLGNTVLYNMAREDIEKIRKGVLFLARTFLEGGATKVYTLLHGHIELSTEEDLKNLEKASLRAEDIDCMAFHPLGTCRMGASEKNGVVAPDHHVYGWEGLYICDGSVIPSSLGVNPQITIMAFATRLAWQMTGKA